MHSYTKTNIICYIFLLLSISVYPQGSWSPAGADLSFPRTLLKSSNVETVRNTLSNSGIIDLYSAIYADANATIPGGSTDVERATKSHIAKDIAFVILMNKKYDSGNIIDLPSDESTALQNKVIPLLQSFETNVDRITTSNLGAYDTWQWRSKELIDYSTAYDLLKGAGLGDDVLSTSKSQIQTFAGNLYIEATRAFYLSFTFFNQVFNNHALMTASALGFASVVLNDATSADVNYQPTSWIGAAMINIENVLFISPKRQSQPNVLSGYYEGPGYFRYAFLNCLPFFRAMGNILPDGTLPYTYSSTVNRSIENPYYDPRYVYLYDWIAKTRMPDGRMIASEDTYINECFPELVLTDNTKYNWTNAYSNYGGSLLVQLEDSRTELWANYIAANPQPCTFTDTLFQSLPSSGDLIFRNSYDSTGTYMHITAKNGTSRINSLGHNQADVSSFMIYKNGAILALDPGYINYDNRNMVGTATEHNMILVDGGGPSIGTVGAANDADGFIENTFNTTKLGYGEARTNYLSVDINRKFLFVRNKYFIDADFISGSASHNYTYQLHGHGLNGYLPSDSGSFTNNLVNEEGTWSIGNESLLAHITANGGMSDFQTPDKVHEVDYGVPGTHTAVYADKNGVQNTEFLAALYPYETTAPVITTLSGSPFTAIKVADGSYTDLAFTQEGTSGSTLSSTISGISDDLTSDASVTLYSLQGVDFDQAFIKNGTGLFDASTQIINSNNRMDISLQATSASTFTGYVSAAGTVEFYIGNTVVGVTGNNINNYYMGALPGYLDIEFLGASNFNIEKISSVVTTSTAIPQKYSLEQNYPNPFNPSTVIKYSLPYSSNLKITLYNELGKKVREIENGFKNAGVYNINFNATGLSSGIYYYTIKANSSDGKQNFMTTKKMVLLH